METYECITSSSTFMTEICQDQDTGYSRFAAVLSNHVMVPQDI